MLPTALYQLRSQPHWSDFTCMAILVLWRGMGNHHQLSLNVQLSISEANPAAYYSVEDILYYNMWLALSLRLGNLLLCAHYCNPGLLERGIGGDNLIADQSVIVNQEDNPKSEVIKLDNRAGPSGCVDIIPTCHHFSVDYDGCNPVSEYYQYLKHNCKATCGLCKYDDACSDVIEEQYCEFFNKSYHACNPLSSYFYYVSANCKSYCGVCPFYGDIEYCQDFVSETDCALYNETYDGCNPDSTYFNYVSANCKLYCGICHPSNNPPCLDTLKDPKEPESPPETNCERIKDICGTGDTLGRVTKDKCRATCKLCQ